MKYNNVSYHKNASRFDKRSILIIISLVFIYRVNINTKHWPIISMDMLTESLYDKKTKNKTNKQIVCNAIYQPGVKSIKRLYLPAVRTCPFFPIYRYYTKFEPQINQMDLYNAIINSGLYYPIINVRLHLA